MHWKEWCWSWNSNTLATWCEELTHWKRPWCWERSKAGGEGDDRGWDGWMASPTQWTWVWVSSGSWWWTGKTGMLQSMGLQRGGHAWETEQDWTKKLRVLSSHLHLNLIISQRSHLWRSSHWGQGFSICILGDIIQSIASANTTASVAVKTWFAHLIWQSTLSTTILYLTSPYFK